jgi:hypothetical protein
MLDRRPGAGQGFLFGSFQHALDLNDCIHMPRAHDGVKLRELRSAAFPQPKAMIGRRMLEFSAAAACLKPSQTAN